MIYIDKLIDNFIDKYLTIYRHNNKMSLNASLYSLDFTYQNSKYSCIVEFYFIHVVCCYLVFLSGLAAMITRIHEKLYLFHKWIGKLYLLFMMLRIYISKSFFLSPFEFSSIIFRTSVEYFILHIFFDNYFR